MGLKAEIWAWRLGERAVEEEVKEKKEKIPLCESIGHQAAVPLPPSRPKSQPRGICASRLGFGPQGWDMGLEAEI